MAPGRLIFPNLNFRVISGGRNAALLEKDESRRVTLPDDRAPSHNLKDEQVWLSPLAPPDAV